jgi:hypothetical protein
MDLTQESHNQKRNGLMCAIASLKKDNRLSTPHKTAIAHHQKNKPNSDRNFKLLNHFGNGMLKSLQIFFAKFSSISV